MLVSVVRRTDVCERKRRQWLGGGGRSVEVTEGRSGRRTSQERLRAACKNAVLAGSGKRSLSYRARSRRIIIGLVWTGLVAEGGTVVAFVEDNTRM